MTRAEAALLTRLARRVEMWHAKHEETGDDRYAYLAAEADRMYRHAREMFGPCVGFASQPPSPDQSWVIS